jgi:ATPase subunit of ABC transporter with duplicated ATPase domains
MGKIMITEKQLEEIVRSLKENQEEGSYMAKQQLFTIATLAQKMWEMMEDGEQLEDWMETKIAQSEQSITSVVKSFMYDSAEERIKGGNNLNFDDLIIGM